jgi:CPA1 family monovalent cation:H+ antiporter
MLQSAARVAQESTLIEQEIAFVLLLSIAAAVAILARRVRLPYTVALVVVGLVLALFPSFLQFDISSELILAVLVPPLVFEATLHIKWKAFSEDLPLVLLLAIGGTLLTTFIVGWIVFQVLDIPLLGALAFGALIAATDPVAVIAFFRSLGVSKRLAILLEGESLLNDGVAIVVFSLALSAAVMAMAGTPNAEFTLAGAILQFLRVSVGGVLVGLILGFAVSYAVLRNVDDHLIETATTVALAFGAYVLAERLHVSGLLAVVAAGLTVGNIGTRNTSPTTQLTLMNFWEFMAFVANSLVFLLIGIEMQLNELVQFIVPIIVAVAAVLLSRAVTVYSMTGAYNRITATRRDVPRAYQHVMFWGGLRGAISLALALVASGQLADPLLAQQIRVMTFGVVLFTILVQGTTIETLLRRLGLVQNDSHAIALQRLQAAAFARRAGLKELDRLRADGIIFRDLWEAMRANYEDELEDSRHALRDHLDTYPDLEQALYLQARADVLKAERTAITDAASRGLVSEEIQADFIRETDNRLAALGIITEGSSSSGESNETASHD